MEANQKLWPILQPTSFSVPLFCFYFVCRCGRFFFAVDIIITQNSWNTISTISFTSLIFVNDSSCSLFHVHAIYNCDLLTRRKKNPGFRPFSSEKKGYYQKLYILPEIIHTRTRTTHFARISTEYLCSICPFEVWSTFNIYAIFMCEYVRSSFHLLLFVMICFNFLL